MEWIESIIWYDQEKGTALQRLMVSRYNTMLLEEMAKERKQFSSLQ